ncbi:Rv3235 family protein [Saccharopolyspora sp. NPDC047091]|uniref:Rv3235 family protein n=1 Tax=Saccharopolyspora sp. NPDC047091 TaxID=3155924 RepID=UPI0033C7334B
MTAAAPPLDSRPTEISALPSSGPHSPGPSRTELANPAGAPADRSSGALASRLGGPVVDVLLGRRPLSQIKSRLSPAVHALFTSTSVREILGDSRTRLTSLHACAVRSDLVEGCAVLASRGRSRAVVLRWERGGAGWLCTFLAVV